MKKAISISGYLLFAFIALLPLGVVLSACFGYTFELTSYSIFAIITALLAVSEVVLSVIYKNSVPNKVFTILNALLTPLSLINAAFYLFEYNRVWIAASMLICAGCCCYLTVKHAKPFTLKITALILSAIMVLPISFFGFVMLIFGNIGQNTVVQSAESPNGKYYVNVINSDQGALGGDTLVDVYENKSVNAFVFKISKKPQRVYHGEWGEFEDMELHWKNENCLVVNSVEYTIE